MIITIINVSDVQAVKKYFTLEVNYKDDNGTTKGKKLMSFTYPLVFNTLKTAKQGEVYEVKNVKEGEFWQWTEATKVEGGAASVAPSKTKEFAAASNDRYETKEERAARQTLIVRQSSLSSAVATLTVGSKAVDPDAVINLAKKYEAYVFSSDPIQELIGMSDDLPD